VDKRSLKTLDRLLVQVADAATKSQEGEEVLGEIFICGRKITLRANVEKCSRLYLVPLSIPAPECLQSRSQARP
jgi:hypothetical protein